MITHQWTRKAQSSGIDVTSDADNKFAVYVSDREFGIETTIPSSFLAANTYYVLRHKVRREHDLTEPIEIFDTEIRYYRNTVTHPEDAIETVWHRQKGSTSWGQPFSEVRYPKNAIAPPAILRSFVRNFADTFRRDPRYLTVPGTAKAEFEFGVEGQTPSQGGIGTPGGLIGAYGGFDIRSLLITEQKVDKIRFNTMSEEATFQAKVKTLPLSSLLFNQPWVPNGDINWKISVGGLGLVGGGGLSQKIFQIFEGTTSMGTDGVATFSATWDGKYHLIEPIGDEVVGVAYVNFNANALTSSNDTVYAREEYANVECYVVPSDVPGSVSYCICVGGRTMMYQSHISTQEASSMGHGWQEVSNNRLVASIGNKVLFYAQGGGQMSWNLVAGEYKPSTRNSYTICEKDTVTSTDFAAESRTPRFTLTFKNQSKMLFNDSGRLIRTLDRNNNADDYFYDPLTGHLERIEADGGLNTYFQRRPDGQPTEIREGDPVTGRLTTLEYFTEEQSELGPLGRLYKVTNPEGEVTEYRYNEQNKLYKIIDPRGEEAVVYLYDFYGRKIQETLYYDLVRTYEYTFFGVDMREEDLSPFGPQASSPDPEIPSGSGLFTSTIFDDRQRLSSISVGHWSYSEVYDSVYNEVTEEFEDVVVGYEISQQEEVTLMILEYTDEDNPFLKTKLIDPDFKTMEWKYDEFGNVIEEKDKEDHITTFTYADSLDDPLNPKHRNLLRLIQRPAVEVREVLTTYEPTELIYDEFGNLEELIDVRDTDSFKQTMTYTPDGLIETITDRRGHTTVFEYSGTPFTKNQKRNLLRIKTPKGESPVDGFRTMHFTYDAYNNVDSVQDDLGNTVGYTFDLLDRMTHMVDARNETTVYVYEDALLKEVLSPPNAASGGAPRKTTFSQDFKGRTTEIFRQFGLSQVSRVAYEFDARSQLRTLDRIRNGMSSYYTFDYDPRGRMKNVHDPFFKGSFIFHPQFCKNTQTVSARGVKKLFRNNDRCLLAEVFDVSGGTEIKERGFEYDALKRLTRSTYYHNGSYTGSVFGLDTYRGFQHTDNVFDERNRLVERTFSDGASVTFSYDPDSNLKSFTGTDQQATRFTYYRDGLLNEVRVETDGLPDKVFKYHYDAAGRLERLDYPGESGLTLYLSEANSTTPGSGYDANGNLLHMRYEINGVPVRSFHYTYDKSGNRETLEIITPSKTSLYQFGYDWFDRLTTVSLGINGAPPALLRVYELDEADNRRFFDDYTQGTSGATYYYTYKGYGAYSSDQVEAIYIYPGAAGHRNVEDFVQLHEALEYDDDGNLTKRTRSNGEIISLDWTTYDRLEKISSSTRNELQESRYGADGLRLRKLDSGTLSTDPNEKVIVREDGLGITTSNVRPLAKQSSSAEPRKSPVRYMQGHAILGFQREGSSYYFLTDALGTVYDILRDDRQIVQSYEYTEYGGLVSQSTDFRSEKTFVGALSVHDDLPDSGLYLMGHRHYDAGVLGRFISRDPIGHAGNLNLYAYPTNPVNAVDPSGLEFEVHVNDFCRVFTPDELPKVGPYLRSRAGLVTGIQVNGHSGTTLGGADPRKGRMGGLWWDRWGEKGPQDGLLIFWEDVSQPDGYDYYNLSDIKFPKLEFVRLKGCNTAGGHPEPEVMKQRYPDYAGDYHDQPTSEHISRAISERYKKALVTGNKGPSWNTSESWDFPATYQNGAPVANPGNVKKK